MAWPRATAAERPADTARRAIRAAVLRRGGAPLQLESLLIDAPRDDEVLVRVTASGICHTDIDCCAADGVAPAVLGHEGAGIVVEVGSGVTRVRPGDHVVLSYQSCGRCAACRAGRPTACAHFDTLNFGFARLDGSSAYRVAGVEGHFFGQSSFASHALATERNCVVVDRALPLATLAPLGCGLQTGAGTVLNTLAVQPGDAIAVLGTGAVGLAAVMAARLVGAGPIIAVDRWPDRLALARELGATHAIGSSREAGAAALDGLLGRRSRGLDHVIEGTGDPWLARTFLERLKPGGCMALLTGGSPRDLVDGRRILAVIQGDAVPQDFIPRLIALWQQGDFPFDRLIRNYAFADINQAIADAVEGRTIKPVLRMDEAA